jgi:hypothetical protein
METHGVSASLLLPRLAYSLAESEALSGLSRSSLYRMIAAGTLRTIVHGRRRLVPAHELERLCRPEDHGVDLDPPSSPDGHAPDIADILKLYPARGNARP